MITLLSREQSTATSEELTRANRNWALLFRMGPQVADTVAEIRSNPRQLKDLFPEVSQGLIAYDRYRGQDEHVIKSRAFHKLYPTGSTSPWINGEDVRRFSMQWNGREYIEYGPLLANPRQPKYFRDARVLVREITNPRIYAAYTEDEAYNDPAIVNILVPEDGLLSGITLSGILNSKLAAFYHFNSSPKATKGSFPKILVDDLREFPLPDPTTKKDELASVERAANLIIKLVAEGASSAALERLEAQLDHAVYEAYELSAAGREIVEQDLRSREAPAAAVV